MTTTKKYLINKLDQSLILKAGYLEIKAKGFTPISVSDETESSIIWALDRDLAEITDVLPTQPEDKKEVDVTIAQTYQGMTSEELKADNELEAAAPKVEAARGVALGAEPEPVTTKAKKSTKAD
jgi:hypothetical protein